MKTDKEQLRLKAKAVLKTLSEADKKVLEENLLIKLSELIKSLSIQKPLVGGFYPIKGEINWLDLKASKAFPGKTGECEMKFFVSELEDSVEFGVTIPCPIDRSKEVYPDLLLIPGLAFGEKGERLGRGAGYYDRYLENYRGVKVGICFNNQIFDNIPMNGHDIYMDYVVTEKKVTRVKRS